MDSAIFMQGLETLMNEGREPEIYPLVKEYMENNQVSIQLRRQLILITSVAEIRYATKVNEALTQRGKEVRLGLNLSQEEQQALKRDLQELAAKTQEENQDAKS